MAGIPKDHGQEAGIDKVLVAYATRRGSTGELGLAIGEQLSRVGLHVDVRPCSRALPPDRYCAVVVGSAVYSGRWEDSAVSYLRAHALELGQRPTWLFQRVPTPQPDQGPFPASLLQDLGCREPMSFSGNLGSWSSGPAMVRPAAWAQRRAGDEWSRLRDWAGAVAASVSVLV